MTATEPEWSQEGDQATITTRERGQDRPARQGQGTTMTAARAAAPRMLHLEAEADRTLNFPAVLLAQALERVRIPKMAGRPEQGLRRKDCRQARQSSVLPVYAVKQAFSEG